MDVMVGSTGVELTFHWVAGDKPSEFAIAAIVWDESLYDSIINKQIGEFIDSSLNELTWALSGAIKDNGHE
jgi:hypothetical protein